MRRCKSRSASLIVPRSKERFYTLRAPSVQAPASLSSKNASWPATRLAANHAKTRGQSGPTHPVAGPS